MVAEPALALRCALIRFGFLDGGLIFAEHFDVAQIEVLKNILFALVKDPVKFLTIEPCLVLHSASPHLFLLDERK